MQNKTQSFLGKIIEKKKAELSNSVIRSEVEGSFTTERKKSTSFFDSLMVAQNDKKTALIAEVKFASPTSPNLGLPKELIKRVKEYKKAGADAVSIITEKHYFNGDISFVSQVKKHVSIPVLQKDFVIDPSQIYEAKKIGSDALLLIARLVDVKRLQQFVELCFAEGIEPVVEIANEEDMKKAIATQTNIIAVNARDLETFTIDVEKACILMKRIPDRFIKLGFSGIHSRLEVEKYQKAGAKGVLVGTSLMLTKNITGFISSLRGSRIHRETKQSHAGDRHALRARDDGKVKVKICGIQQIDDAEAAIKAGADYLGFIFAKDSKRSIDRKTARQIIDKVKGKAIIVGVFNNNTVEEITSLCEELAFDFVQLHGEIDQEFYKKITLPIIRSYGLLPQFAVDTTMQKMKQVDVPYYMIDRLNPGEGESLSLENAVVLAKSFPLFFAGGLTPENVAEVVIKVKPYAVDVITGVKTDGKFDSKKMKQFIQNAKGVSL